MEDGRWKMEDGKGKMEKGKGKREKGRWKREKGKGKRGEVPIITHQTKTEIESSKNIKTSISPFFNLPSYLCNYE